MKHIVDLATWERKDNFEFFRDFLNPFVSLTLTIDATKAKTIAKEKGFSFFLYYAHAILLAANKIPEFRYRFDKEGNVVYYDEVNLISPIKVPGHIGFVSMCFPYFESRKKFIETAKNIMSNWSESSAYGAENSLTDYDSILISAVPELPFTAVTCTQKHRQGSDYPLIVVGKMENDFRMPMAISFHHGFIDGEHITAFYKKIQETLDDENI